MRILLLCLISVPATNTFLTSILSKTSNPVSLPKLHRESVYPRMVTSSNHEDSIISQMCRRNLLAISLNLVIGASLPVWARSGEPAKVKGVDDFAADFMGCQDERTNGCADGRTEKSVYEREAVKIMGARLVKINNDWSKLESKVDAALSRGRCAEVTDALGLRMGTIKPLIREVTRLASGGDVFVRPEGGVAKFDYRSGAFELEPAARQAEDLFATVSRLDAACRARDSEEAMAEWEETKEAFALWARLLAAAPPPPPPPPPAP